MEKPLKKNTKSQRPWCIPMGVVRFLGWWIAFFGLYSSSSVCPFCGQPGCPVGIGSAGLFAGIFAIIIHSWRSMTNFLKTILIKVQQTRK